MKRIVVLLLVLHACAPVGPAPPASESPTAAPPGQSEASLPRPSLQQTPRLVVAQARGVATVLAFFSAYNEGRVDEALRLLTDDVLLTDCDYRAGRSIRADGKDQAAALIRAKVADHDAFVLGEFGFNPPEDVVGRMFAIDISYARRTSDTLRSLGFPDGIVSRLAAKAILTKDGDRLRALANGSDGPPYVCQPR